ncbi:MAG: hypothetical protein LYZ69_02330 [Nitrososphaerales archaeon]|nr:hypothetical protein [Nitrososphaerales archaeon]
MGTFTVRTMVSKAGPSSPSKSVDLVADTGATFTTLPSSLLRELMVDVERTLRFALPGGSTVERGAGHIRIILGGGYALPSTTVVFGDEGVFLLGAVTLEDLSLAVDPTNRRLVPVEGRLLALCAR